MFSRKRKMKTVKGAGPASQKLPVLGFAPCCTSLVHRVLHSRTRCPNFWKSRWNSDSGSVSSMEAQRYGMKGGKGIHGFNCGC
jgi:hypothetical protein